MTAPIDSKSRILPLEAFAGLAVDPDSGKFVAQYPHPFLILETKEGDFGEAGFQTLATTEPTPETRKAPAALEPAKAGSKDDLKKTYVDENDGPPTIADNEIGTTTDLDIDVQKPKTPVAEKHEEIKKKLQGAKMVTYVCPLVKRDVNKFASMITLGRAANNDIRINLPSISKFHAYFTHVQSNNTWFIADANSSNGTWVSGERLKGDRSRIKLANGASIKLGQDVQLRFFEAKSFFEFLRTRLGGGKA